MPRLSELPWLLLIYLAQRRVVEGCQVCVVESDANADEVFGKVEDALRLLEKYGPRFHARLRRDVKRLLFTETSGGNYLTGLRTCRIAIDFARRVPPLELAMMIVHEATHARLSRRGFSYADDCRERIERICVGAEIAFAQRVPGSDAAIGKAHALLEKEWWTSENSLDATMAELRERGVPAWLTKIVRRFARRRGRR